MLWVPKTVPLFLIFSMPLPMADRHIMFTLSMCVYVCMYVWEYGFVCYLNHVRSITLLFHNGLTLFLSQNTQSYSWGIHVLLTILVLNGLV